MPQDFFGDENPFLQAAEQYDPRLTAQSLFFSFGDQVGQGANQQRAFQNQFSRFYNQYLGQLGSELREGAGPKDLSSMQSFFTNNPVTQSFAALPPSLTGETTGRFAPRTRFLTGF
jgi:hypothetical protein